ncbi:hypothetical protein K501DRAFT_336031 [Backusella circina FSU 941]|nr:hypothetical protein K501DRAFT_336031 [Backusella circina FSU 941]
MLTKFSVEIYLTSNPTLRRLTSLLEIDSNKHRRIQITLESSFILASSNTVCPRRENDLFLKCPVPKLDDFSGSLFPPVLSVLQQNEQTHKTEKQQAKAAETTTATVVKTTNRKEQEPTPERKPLVSFEEWQKKQVLVHENEYNRHNKRKANAVSSNGRRQQMVDSVDGGFSDDFGSMFEGGNMLMEEMPNMQDDIIEPTHNNKGKAGHRDKKLGNPRMKSLKERFNYASTDCAATVRKANKEAKGANAILYESKDQYLLNKCSADNKFVIINLCEPIRIDTIVMANYEFFSSTFKDFRIYVADRYPSKDWQLLGQWQARNTRDLQVFKVDDKSGWPEYIKIEFKTHYGREYYCPLSLVRVYGMSMMEYYNRVERQGLSDSDEEDGLEDEHLWPADVREQIIQPQFINTNTSESFPIKHQSHDDDEEEDSLEEVGIPPVVLDSTETSNNHDSMIDDASEGVDSSDENDIKVDEKRVDSSANSSEMNDDNMTIMDEKTTNIIPKDEQQQHTSAVDSEKIPQTSSSMQPLEESLLSSSILLSSSSKEDSSTLPESSQYSESSSTQESASSIPQESLTSSPSSSSSKLVTSDNVISSTSLESSGSTIESSSADSIVTSDSTVTNRESAATDVSPSSVEPESEKSTPAIVTTTSTTTEEVRQPASKIVVPKEKSTTQESIYKTIMKRLNALEVNATLSQRYLDDQNKMLNDVFTDMEKRHQEQLMMLISHLNETASHKIDSMKRRYEKWYDDLKDQTDNDMREMTAKISILADQLSFERRISLTQLVIMITLFVFMALSRGTFSTLSPVMAAREEERKKRQSANQAAALLSTISHSLKPNKNKTKDLPSIVTKPENPRRHSDDPYFIMDLEEKRPRALSTSSKRSLEKSEEDAILSKQSYKGLNIDLEPELLSHKLNDVLKQQMDEQRVPLSTSEAILLSEEEEVDSEERDK